MKSNVFPEAYRPIFAEKLKAARIACGLSEAQLAAKFREIYVSKPGNPNKSSFGARQIKMYERGETTPSKEFLSILKEILGQELGPRDTDYRFCDTRTRDHEINFREFAEERGLNLDFFHWIKSFSEFDEDFPVYAPLAYNPMVFVPGTEYFRLSLAETEKWPSSKFQITRDGKTYNLSRGDIEYMIDLQKEIKEFVLSAWEKRAKEMKAEEEMLRDTCTRCYDNGLKTPLEPTVGDYRRCDKYADAYISEEIADEADFTRISVLDQIDIQRKNAELSNKKEEK